MLLSYFMIDTLQIQLRKWEYIRSILRNKTSIFMYILVNIYICLKYIFNDAITGNYIYIMYVCLAYNIY